MNTRKISIRLPMDLFHWLDEQVGEGESLSGVVLDFLSRFKSGRVISRITSRSWLNEFIACGQRQGLGNGTVTQTLKQILSDAIEHEACRKRPEFDARAQRNLPGE